ncbi:hypothetical protein CLBKI_27540 [Clostridium beijerinckii]|nr:hypothetical protein CLBKI_27540 [Clostridium beijerinckii]
MDSIAHKIFSFVSTIPLGSPVEPDEKTTNAVSLISPQAISPIPLLTRISLSNKVFCFISSAISPQFSLFNISTMLFNCSFVEISLGFCSIFQTLETCIIFSCVLLQDNGTETIPPKIHAQEK